jgi:uncharacterized repeat protein (TIGR03803 family)
MRNTIRPLVSGRCLHVASVVLTLAVLMMPAVLATQTAHAQTYSVLYSFKGGTDGANPYGSPLLRDSNGNLWGTTPYGGAYGNGTVFKVNKNGKEIFLYSFKGAPDGAYPVSPLVQDSSGNFYGSTYYGGTGTCLNANTSGCGTIFKLSAKSGGGWNETVLYSLVNAPTDGQYPVGGLIRDKSGNWCGTSQMGGSANKGTVFKLDTGGMETLFYSFLGSPDTYSPWGLLIDSLGHLYGIAAGGAHNLGAIYMLDTTSKEKLLYSFRGTGLGRYPNPGLVRHANGDIFGTTQNGSHRVLGTMFKINKTGHMTVVHGFVGGKDGEYPVGGLVQDKAGNFYGTTFGGGDSTCICGVVFKVDTTGKETIVHAFTDGTDGGYPQAGLFSDKTGNLYGTTEFGGNDNCNLGFSGGCGTVFKLTP